MQLVLASSNRGKVREFRQMCRESIVPFSELLEPFEIVEDGETFAQNALIKAKTIYEKLGREYLVIADDSGISVPLLGGEPGIYSARYAGEGASDRENLEKLIAVLKERGVTHTPAHYTAAIAIVSRYGEYIVHGWMYGEVITQKRGDKGFGYDPIFIPEGYDQTLGELDEEIKAAISHRGKALAMAKPVIAMLLEKEAKGQEVAPCRQSR
jgi:XTP/dITP diphosphohydrolase